MAEPILLKSPDMARFAARGFLRLDAQVPDEINTQFIDEVGRPPESPTQLTRAKLKKTYARLIGASELPLVRAGTPLAEAYPQDCALDRMLKLPEVAGAILSLVGPGCRLDLYCLHVPFPPAFYESMGIPHTAQPTHQDSTIDPRRAFDLQIMYFPHEVSLAMGGTRFIPGTHLRIVSEAAVSRYQNMRGQQHVVCPAGTLLLLHHGLWHGGGMNRSDQLRYMFKIRLAPTVRQERLWDTADLDEQDDRQRPIFFIKEKPDPGHIHTILTTPEPWFEADTGRLEYLNRIRFWRRLTGDDAFDANYWVTRVENEPA